MFMDEDTPMSSEPEDDLERLFAAEEAAIKDDGFTARVVEQAQPANRWRRPVIYGAGLVGAGFALGGVTEIGTRIRFGEWFAGVTNAMASSVTSSVNTVVTSANLETTQALPDTVLIAAAALVAGVSCLIVVAAAQTR
jgi:hypothetical protein